MSSSSTSFYLLQELMILSYRAGKTFLFSWFPRRRTFTPTMERLCLSSIPIQSLPVWNSLVHVSPPCRSLHHCHLLHSIRLGPCYCGHVFPHRLILLSCLPIFFFPLKNRHCRPLRHRYHRGLGHVQATPSRRQSEVLVRDGRQPQRFTQATTFFISGTHQTRHCRRFQAHTLACGIRHNIFTNGGPPVKIEVTRMLGPQRADGIMIQSPQVMNARFLQAAYKVHVAFAPHTTAITYVAIDRNVPEKCKAV